MNTLTISAIFCAFAATTFAIVISAKSIKDKQYRWFAVFCSLIALWSLLFFFSRIFYSILFERFHLVATLLIGPVTLYFLIQFTETPQKAYQRLQPATNLVVLSGALLLLGVLLPDDILHWFKYSVHLYVIILISYAFYTLIDDLRKSKLSAKKRQKQIYLISSSMITFLALISNGFAEAGFPVPAMGHVFLIFFLYFIYQTITKQKVLDVEDLTAQGVLFFVLAAILTLIYAVLVSWVEGPALFIFNTFVASFVILILFDPIKSLIKRATSEFFLKGRLKTEKKLEAIQRAISETTDIRDLTHEVVVGLKDALGATQSHFFLVDREGLKFNLMKSLAPDPSKIHTTEIPIQHDFIKYLQRRYPQPSNIYFIHQEILERGRSTPKERLENTLKMFQSLPADVAFAFIIDGKMLGLCTFINETSDIPYSLSDFELLIPFSKQIALSLKNLEIYEKIRQRDRLAAVGEMAAGLAHEIRNPLGAIKGAAQYLQPVQDNSPQNEFLKIIVDETNRLNKVVTQFLNFANPTDQNFVETDVGELLKKTLQTASTDMPANIHLSTQFNSKTLFVMVDPERIKQVFLNMILNAIQAMPTGGELKVSLKDLKEEVQIIFEDTGVGIAPEDQKKLFIPFFTTREGGSGLGLPICQKIIRASHGAIKVESELRKGTKFIITLPHKHRGP